MVCSLCRLHILCNSEYTTNLQWQRTCNIHVEIAYNAFYSKVQMCPDTFSKTPVARFLLATISCKWLLNLNIFFWVVAYWMFHCVYQFLEINLSKNRKHSEIKIGVSVKMFSDTNFYYSFFKINIATKQWCKQEGGWYVTHITSKTQSSVQKISFQSSIHLLWAK